MPVFTNRHGLPDPLFQLLGRETYSRGSSRRSCTQLIDSPRLVALKEKHRDNQTAEVDISDRIWALFGTAVHKLIEDGLPHSNWHLTEERIFTEVNGWKVSGAVDLQLMSDGSVRLIDWKVCAIWSVKGGVKIEWENQLNMLAYFIEKERGLKPSGLQIGALIRDWSRAESRRNPQLPNTPFHMVDVPLWSFQDREDYVLERVRLHQEAELALTMGEEPEPCTDEEMWAKASQWAVFKLGNKRATKVFNTGQQAVAFAAEIGGRVEHRPGELTRCGNYCEAAPFCIYAPKAEPEDTGF